MPVFTSTIPEKTKHLGFDLVRCPADRPIVAYVTSDEMIVTETHYWGGRTVPHEPEDCPACAQMCPKRVHCYVSAMDIKTRAHFLFECTAHAGVSFEDYRKAHGTLRGCLFQAHRPKRTKNGKVEIATKPGDLTKVTLPAEPNVIKALCTIWRIPCSEADSSLPVAPDRDIRHDKKRNGRCRNVPVNVGEPPKMSDILAGNGESHRTKQQL